MRRFLRKPVRAGEPLPVTMTGVRMGERVLQIGFDDATRAALLAAKAGLSGHAVIAVDDEGAAARARAAVAHHGTLAEVVVAPLSAIPLDGDGFDLAVIHGVGRLPGGASPDAALRESYRLLRPGGRIIVIEAGQRARLFGLLGRAPATSRTSAVALLEQAGFRSVRPIGDREGLLFTEGLKAG